MKFCLQVVIFFSLIGSGCIYSNHLQSDQVGAVQEESHGLTLGFSTGWMDTSVSPRKDFYRYANGSWLKNNQIPDDESRYSSFHILIDKSREDLKNIISKAGEASDHNSRLIGSYYGSYIDKESRQQNGLKDVYPIIRSIDEIDHLDGVYAQIGLLNRMFISTFLDFSVHNNPSEGGRKIPFLSQPSLTLEDRKYYIEDNEETAKRQKELFHYATRLFELANIGKSSEAIAAILELETALAKIAWERADMRDPVKTTNIKTSEQFFASMPEAPWVFFFKGMGAEKFSSVNLYQLSYVEQLPKILRETSLATLKDFLAFKTLDSFAAFLSDEFVAAHFHLHTTLSTGTNEQKPMWKKAVDSTSNKLGEPLSQLYVKNHFSKAAKEKVLKMVFEIKKTFQENLEQNPWMGEDTKKQALKKLAHMRLKIGYPNSWRSFAKLSLKKDRLIQNIIHIHEFEFADELTKIDQPIDPDEWLMAAHEVNAYYNQFENEIVFPAGILQPPFFDEHADDASNFSAIGAVIGHEMGHAFDDKGSKFDHAGRVQNWWQEEDRQQFNERAGNLKKQFAAFEPLPGKRFNPDMVAGEAIGDLTGLIVAHKAYINKSDRNDDFVIQGFTPLQRFFISFAQVWAAKSRERSIERRLVVGVHPIEEFRVLGTVKNLDGFYEAFGIQEGDGMFLDEKKRAYLW